MINLKLKLFEGVSEKLKRRKFLCPFCEKKTSFVNMGNPARKNVLCAVCGSLERHRFLLFLYKIIFLGSTDRIKLLHMSPEKCIHDFLLNYKNIDYVSADLNPEGFSFTNCKKENFCNMSFENKCFDIILSNQIMEHIENELEYLKEMRRCLKEDGILIINIPFKVGLIKTFEDTKIISSEERELIYGQKDHVRIYGEDAGERFKKAGFIVNRVNEDVFDKGFLKRYRLSCVNSKGINPGGFFILRKKVN